MPERTTTEASGASAQDRTPEYATTIARLLRGDDPASLDLDALPEPWCTIAARVATADVPARSLAFAAALDALDGDAADVKRAVYEAAARLDAPRLPLDGGYHTTDLGNARRFADRHGEDVHFSYGLDTWFCWDGTRWRADETGEVERLAKETVCHVYELAAQARDEDVRKALARWAIRSESANRLKALAYLARSEPGVPILPGVFDGDPWLLNVRNGTIDLRTGDLRPHSRQDLITQLAPVEYDPDATLPLWERFLDETTGGDRDLQGYLQRAVGYTLTGRTDLEHLFFIHGPTRTGKSTFLEALKSALGDYCRTADFGTFLKGHAVGRPRADIARLRGARMVVSIEVDEGSKLAEALLKMLTGGDTITARALYHDSFEFRPAFKLWLAANAAPKVNDREKAIWERIRRIPFTREVPREKRDPLVKERLRDPAIGGPAILAWAVRGCLAWQGEGLGTCAAVERSTDDYRHEMDPLCDFIDACCVLAPAAWASSRALRVAYETWAAESGADWLVRGKEWGERLRALGCSSKVRRVADQVTRGWQGIGLRGSLVQETLSET
jgi:putative DNA primase/helicase